MTYPSFPTLNRQEKGKINLVYVVQETPGKNLLPARKFGELEALLPAYSQIQLDAEGPVATCREKLKGFGDDDHLLAIGDPVAIAVASAVASEYNDGRLSVLKWDRQEHSYSPIFIDIRKGWRNVSL